MNVSLRTIALCCCVAVIGASAAPAQADQFRDIDWHGDVLPGTTMAVNAINGSIVADGAPGSHVSLRLHVTSTSNNVASVRLKVKQSPGRIAICADTPYEKYRDDCEHGGDTLNIGFHDDMRLEYTLHVPRGVDLETKTVNGSIDAEGLASDVAVKTVNGRVKIATSGVATVKAVNGRIDVHIGGAGWHGRLAFETVNGTIAIHLPRRAGFSVHAHVLNGSIDAKAFNLEPKWNFVGSSLDGTVGSNADGRSLHLTTVNGRISLLADD
jgi:hypothetical protein